jgi:hypothetical protein
MTDFRIADHGTIVTIEPVSVEARNWLLEMVDFQPWQWMGPVLNVDHRMAQGLVDAIGEAGFEIEEGAYA